MNEKPFNIIKAQFPEFYDWLKEIVRYGNKVEQFVLPNYKNGVRVEIYTHNYCYSIRVKESAPNNDASENNNYRYMGCVVTARKPRAGEDWNRGNDLPDGKYCKETWDRIKNAIIAYELVKIIKPKREVSNETLEEK